MTAAKQPRGNAGKGRRKGVPNKVTGDVKAMVLTAPKRAGGAQYLEEQAHKNPVAFMSLLGKILPTEVKTDGAPILLEQIVLLALERRTEEASAQPLVIDATPVSEQPGAGESTVGSPSPSQDPQDSSGIGE